jgi:hypothetical protein
MCKGVAKLGLRKSMKYFGGCVGINFEESTYTLGLVNLPNVELNPICHLLALLGSHPILHISRIRVN